MSNFGMKYFRLGDFGDLLSGSATTTSATAVTVATYSPPNGSLLQVGADTVALPYSSASINTSAASSSALLGTVQIKVAGVSAMTINWVCQSGISVVAQ